MSVRAEDMHSNLRRSCAPMRSRQRAIADLRRELRFNRGCNERVRILTILDCGSRVVVKHENEEGGGSAERDGRDDPSRTQRFRFR